MAYRESAEDQELEQWVFRSRRAQGLPDHIEDTVVLSLVAELLKDEDSTKSGASHPNVRESPETNHLRPSFPNNDAIPLAITSPQDPIIDLVRRQLRRYVALTSTDTRPRGVA
jgi:hypothetical protein